MGDGADASSHRSSVSNVRFRIRLHVRMENGWYSGVRLVQTFHRASAIAATQARTMSDLPRIVAGLFRDAGIAVRPKAVRVSSLVHDRW